MLDVIVIGGGPAGVTAALRARELGASVALVERDRLGGTCTNDGCVPTRVLAHAARLMREAQQHAMFGLISEPPQLDLARLLDRAQDTVYAVHEKKQLLKHLEDSGVIVYEGSGAASFVDPHTIQLAGGERTLTAAKFIICAGGRARRLPFPGAEYTLTHGDIWRLQSLPRTVAIIGAAATGCQLASILNTFGSQVTLLDVAPTILPAEDASVSETMQAAFAKRGINIITGIAGVSQVEPGPYNMTLTYNTQDGGRQLAAESVISCVGWPGNADTLNLAAAGVEVERSYIVTDDCLRTSASHIYAAGDIDGRMMLVQSASYEARAAAENAVLGGDRSFHHQIVPHGGFTDPEYGSVGLTEQQADAQGHDYLVALASYVNLDRAVIDGYTDGFCKLVVDRASHRVLGGHVVGEQAVEVVQLIAAHMASEATVEHLAALELAYPTYTAIVGLAARRALFYLGEMHLAREWRELGPHYAAEWERRDSLA